MKRAVNKGMHKMWGSLFLSCERTSGRKGGGAGGAVSRKVCLLSRSGSRSSVAYGVLDACGVRPYCMESYLFLERGSFSSNGQTSKSDGTQSNMRAAAAGAPPRAPCYAVNAVRSHGCTTVGTIRGAGHRAGHIPDCGLRRRVSDCEPSGVRL